MNNMFQTAKQYLLKYPKTFLVVLCILTRLPQLLSPYLFLDPDECVSATMAQYLAKGQDASLFFWGQYYGLTILENLFIVPFYLLLGVCTLSVKLGMLSLWSIGIVFLYQALLALTHANKERAFAFTALFLLLPAWAVWSMKARGGYITGFTCSMGFLYLLFHEDYRQRWVCWLIGGLLLQLVYQSQQLWFIGLLPLLLYVVFRYKLWKQALTGAAAVAASGYLFYRYKAGIHSTYTPSIYLPRREELLWYTTRFPAYLYNSFHGKYYFNNFYYPGRFSMICSVLCTVTLFFLLAAGLYHLLFRRKSNGLFIWSVLFIIGFYLFSHLTHSMEGRYLLPMTCFMVLSGAIYSNRFPSLKPIYIPGAVWMLLGAGALFSFRTFEFEQDKKKNIDRLIRYLEHNKLNYTFSTDCMLPWHLTFYAKEKLISRMPYYPGRYQPYHDKVDSVFFQGGTVALIGYMKELKKADTGTYDILGPFYIFKHPAKEAILNNFQFTKQP